VFLTPAQLIELTGYQRPAAQRRWLKANGFTFLDGADGRPRVLISHVEQVMGGRRMPKATQPNVVALQQFCQRASHGSKTKIR